jgi:hypothetical protein
MGLDITVRDRFAKWVDEWNRKDAQKYGAVVLVPQLGDADVILARYLVRERVTSHTTSRVVQAYAYDPKSGTTVPTRFPKRTQPNSLRCLPTSSRVALAVSASWTGTQTK